MKISALDHIVLTVRDLDAAVRFYCSALGMKQKVFGEGRIALSFGTQTINLHPLVNAFDPKATLPTPGSADLCFVTDLPLEDAMAHVQRAGVECLAGPVQRTGALGPIWSFYCRDPDGNLIEVASYCVAH
ncbi:MAG: VOC family protein [Synechococcus sp.]